MMGDKLSKVFHGCYFFIFFIVFLYIIARQDYVPALILLMFAALVLMVLGYQSLKAKNITDAQLNKTTLIVLGIMAVLMAIMGWLMIPQLQTDLGMVYYSAMEIIQNGKMSDTPTIYNQITTITNMTNNEYFVVYPNNLPILFLMTTFYRIVCAFGVSMETDFGIYMGILLNLAAILSAIWLGTRIAKKIWGNRSAMCFLLLAALFLPYYTNVHRFYTDTLSMPFPVLAIYLYLRIREMDTLKKRLPLLMGLGACLAVGFLLKGSCIIIGVALLVHALISRFTKKTWASIAVVAVCFGLIYQGWNLYVRNCSWVDMSRENEQTFPAAHWIMMALSGSGGFHPDDFNYTYSFGTKKEKQAADIERAIEKIKSYDGIGSFLNFELKKIADTWGDGKFAQQVHLTWMKKDTLVNEFVRTDGRFNTIFYLYTTTFVLSMYVLFLLSIARGIFRKNSMITLFNICIFGVLLFFAIWETKSRYLLNFTPIFLLCMVDGLKMLDRLVRKKGSKGADEIPPDKTSTHTQKNPG